MKVLSSVGSPIMAVPYGIALSCSPSVTYLAAFIVYGRSFRTNLARRFVVLKLQQVPSVCRWWFKVSDTIKYSPLKTQTASFQVEIYLLDVLF